MTPALPPYDRNFPLVDGYQVPIVASLHYWTGTGPDANLGPVSGVCKRRVVELCKVPAHRAASAASAPYCTEALDTSPVVGHVMVLR